MPKQTLPTPNLSELTHAEKDALIVALLERLAALENKTGKDSHNSSKPPSSDGLQRRPKSLKEKSGAKAGGQVGHLGTTRKQSAVVDHTIIHPLPLACDVCGAFLAGQESVLENEIRQVVDLPPIRFEVTEHRILRAQCTCGAQHCSAFPPEVASAVQYGAGVRAASVYLTQYQQLPYQRCADAFRDMFGIKLSAGTIVNFTRQAANRLAPAVTQIKEAVVQSPVAHFDETGMRVGKTLTWLHSASTTTMTWYGHHARRGEAAMNALAILPRYRGVAVHDGLSSYRQYSCLHALCNAHHLRELLYVFESTQQQWARDMMHLLCAAKDEMAARADLDAALPAQRCAEIKAAYLALIARGMVDNPEQLRPLDQAIKRGRVKQSDAYNLLGRLQNYADDVLRFTTDHNVPFDNNQAERDIRMPKLKQKVSGCFRATQGIEAFCTIRSYLATLRKNQKDLFQALRETFSGNAPAAV
jgi:transposase